MTGVVVSYDEPVGIGVVRDNESNVEYPFHCTQITDGTRTINAGESVTFTVNQARPKGPEAYEITKLAP
jgi:cold shock CspA family protein